MLIIERFTVQNTTEDLSALKDVFTKEFSQLQFSKKQKTSLIYNWKAFILHFEIHPVSPELLEGHNQSQYISNAAKNDEYDTQQEITQQVAATSRLMGDKYLKT